MKVLVTGATGFVGKAIVIEFLSVGHQVVEVGSARSANSPANFEGDSFFGVNIADAEDVNSLKSVENIDVVIHAAGLAHQFGNVSKEHCFAVNVEGTANICGLAAKLGAKYLILISSVSVYGKTIKRVNGIDESSVCKPEGFYAESKFESEKIARLHCEKNDIALTILRPATVIGEGDAGNVAKLIRTIDKRLFFWLGHGENFKSLIYKRDVARACLRLLDRSSSVTEIYNVTAEPLKIIQLVNFIEKSLSKRVLPVFFPINLARELLKIGSSVSRSQKIINLSETLEKWIATDVYLSEKIKNEFDFEPETSVETAIGLEVYWYLKHK